MKRFSSCWPTILLFLASGCTRPDVPDGLASPDMALRQAAGTYALVNMDTSSVSGELLAVERDTLFLMRNDSLRAIPKGQVREAKVFLQEYPLSGGGVAAWTILGMLSTVSNGFGLVLTAPAWILTGIITGATAANRANSGDVSYPDDPWTSLCQFARFPQGLLPGIPREQLKGAGAGSKVPMTVQK